MMWWQWRSAVLVVGLIGALGAPSTEAGETQAPGIDGVWVLNPELSDDPSGRLGGSDGDRTRDPGGGFGGRGPGGFGGGRGGFGGGRGGFGGGGGGETGQTRRRWPACARQCRRPSATCSRRRDG